MRVLVTGGTGFVGRRLLRELDDALLVTRSANRLDSSGLPNSPRVLQWAEPDREPLHLGQEVDIQAVVHLMGESIADGRWTAEKKMRIRQSRVAATKNLVQALSVVSPRPTVLVSASAMGFYGSRGDQVLDEAASSGTDFLAEVCREWEDSAIAARQLGIRVVLLRIGLVLGQGGFLKSILPIFRRGLGGRLGNGKQWTSWIHVDDLVQLILLCIRDSTLSGPINASSPFPVRNSELTGALAQAVNRPALLPVPKLALRLVFGEMASVMLASIRMQPEKASAAGFAFNYPTIREAMADLATRKPTDKVG